MKGAIADPSVKTIKNPNKNKKNKMGNKIHFLLSMIYTIISLIFDNLLICYPIKLMNHKNRSNKFYDNKYNFINYNGTK